MEIIDGIVFEVAYIGNAVIRTFYDYEKHTEITYNGTIITATIKDYLGYVCTDYNEPVRFLINDEERESASVNGVAVIAYAGLDGVTVRTDQPDMRNGELIIGTLPVPVDPIQQLIADNAALKLQNEEMNAQFIDLFEELINKGVL